MLREINEEVGVRVRDVTYLGSQAWPFPRSRHAPTASKFSNVAFFRSSLSKRVESFANFAMASSWRSEPPEAITK